MSNKHIKFYLVLMTLVLLPLAATGCDLLGITEDSGVEYSAEVEITGLETAEHYHVFALNVDGPENKMIFWENEGEVKDGTLQDTVSNLEGEVEVELIIDNDHIEGSYSVKEGSRITSVSNTSSRAEFNLKLDYEPEPEYIDIAGPETIYPPQEKNTEESYQFSGQVLDQYDNSMDKALNWEIVGSPPGLEINNTGVITVDWDAHAGEFQLRTYLQDDHNMSQQKPVTVNYLPEDKTAVYEEAIAKLEEEMEDFYLDSVRTDLDLPSSISVSTLEQDEDINFEVIWSAEDHEAVTIDDSTAQIQRGWENITGYINAFIETEDVIAEQAGADPRQKKFQVTVLKRDIEEAELKVDFALDHNFPAAKVDDFYEVQSSDGRQNGEIVGGELSSSDMRDRPEEVPGEFIVGLHSAGAAGQIENSLQEKNYTVIDKNETLNSLLVRKPAGISAESARNDIKSLSSVRYIEPNKYVYALSTDHPQADMYSEQWHYPQIRMPQTWNEVRGGSNVRVAILDTGIDAGHPDLADFVDAEAGHNFAVYEDFIDTGDETADDTPDINGHGTHVAGTVLATSSGGTAGVMRSGELIPVKVLGNDSNGSGTLWSIAKGILYAAGYEVDVGEGESVSIFPSEPADIINLSLGGAGGNAVHNAIKKARENDVLIIAAAGNNGTIGEILYPAAYPEVIAVGSTNYNYPGEPELAEHSNISSELDVLAPGGSSNDEDYVWSTSTTHPESQNSDNKYSGMVGTSMAAPHASGVAGLMLSQGISPDEVRDILRDTAMNLTTVNFEAGLINSYWAVNRVDSFKAELYRNNDGNWENAASSSVPIAENKVGFEINRPGEYKVEIRADVQNTGKVDPGDYKGSYGPVEVHPGDEIGIEVLLQEQEN